ncbi:DUF3592 domain-containing protein [Erwiniaceae bacterium BAC15a-03b]|uniref:DUF3592 domain-containing protein n=1 Tax=Winslowiella arboricola TaxID=2978220 RepID=A0A9J6PH33_9GAMM|nr:DUF3592 domain-containing protein [Winslowiella arboricola]MCU5771712.1 DUF3592 domain-containing protein [Winslowiella arboricola]MCU5777617.1 DUF3592 domain-containing protein [Winslowiella arboricola]
MNIVNYFVTLPLMIIPLIVIGFMIYAVLSVNARSREHKRLKENGTETTGQITNIASRSGGNSAYVNVTITATYFNKDTNQKCKGSGDAVIDIIKAENYQPGKNVQLIYNNEKPDLIFLLIPHPLMERMKK